MEKILTVSIAAYNIEKYIDSCIESFISPEIVNNVEVIVVNDGSTDSTLRLAKKYNREYPEIIKVIDKENGGWGSTVNASLEAATGRYFKLLDGDDYFDNNNLKGFVELLKQATADVVMTPYESFSDESGEVLQHIAIDDCESGGIYDIEDVKDKMLIAMHACTFRTAKLRDSKLRVTEKCFYTDIEYTLKALNACDTIQYFDKVIYMYRLGREGQSVSMNSLIKHWDNHYLVLSKLLDFEKEELKEENKSYYIRRITEMVGIQYNIFWSMKLNRKQQKLFKSFDIRIRKEFPWYDKFNSSKLKIIRNTNYKAMSITFLLLRIKRTIRDAV